MADISKIGDMRAKPYYTRISNGREMISLPNIARYIPYAQPMREILGKTVNDEAFRRSCENTVDITGTVFRVSGNGTLKIAIYENPIINVKGSGYDIEGGTYLGTHEYGDSEGNLQTGWYALDDIDWKTGLPTRIISDEEHEFEIRRNGPVGYHGITLEFDTDIDVRHCGVYCLVRQPLFDIRACRSDIPEEYNARALSRFGWQDLLALRPIGQMYRA